MERVLVTGVSGFLGSHVALQLLKKGYSVRGSVRDMAKAEPIKRTLADAETDISSFEVVELNLMDDRGWQEAMEGCSYLQHIASPFVISMPKDKAELIRPAVEGTQRALKTALKAGIQRIVMTSSLAAIDGGHSDYSQTLTEKDWTDIHGAHVNAYAESKTLAEREAWAIMDANGSRDQLAVINPGAILGPLLDDDVATTGAIIQRLLTGKIPMVPDIILEYVDVRDVAGAHIAAMTFPLAGGNRHIISDASLSLMEVANILRKAFPAYSTKLPRRPMPALLASILSVFDVSLRDSRAQLGIRKHSDATRGTALVGKPLIPAREAVIASAQSIILRGLV
jgi:dihydroflavonol-4-reductase